MFSLCIQSPMKSVGNQLGQQVKELQQKVLRLERERETALSRTSTEKELQIQVSEQTESRAQSCFPSKHFPRL